MELLLERLLSLGGCLLLLIQTLPPLASELFWAAGAAVIIEGVEAAGRCRSRAPLFPHARSVAPHRWPRALRCLATRDPSIVVFFRLEEKSHGDLMNRAQIYKQFHGGSGGTLLRHRMGSRVHVARLTEQVSGARHGMAQLPVTLFAGERRDAATRTAAKWDWRWSRGSRVEMAGRASVGLRGGVGAASSSILVVQPPVFFLMRGSLSVSTVVCGPPKQEVPERRKREHLERKANSVLRPGGRKHHL